MQRARRVGSSSVAVGEAAVGRERQPLEPHPRSPFRKSRASATRSAIGLVACELVAQIAAAAFRRRVRISSAIAAANSGSRGGRGDQRVDVERVGLGARDCPRRRRGRDLQPLDPAIAARSRSRARARRPPSSRGGRRAGRARASTPVSVRRTASGRPPARRRARASAAAISVSASLSSATAGDVDAFMRPARARRARPARPRRCGRRRRSRAPRPSAPVSRGLRPCRLPG